MRRRCGNLHGKFSVTLWEMRFEGHELVFSSVNRRLYYTQQTKTSCTIPPHLLSTDDWTTHLTQAACHTREGLSYHIHVRPQHIQILRASLISLLLSSTSNSQHSPTLKQNHSTILPNHKHASQPPLPPHPLPRPHRPNPAPLQHDHDPIRRRPIRGKTQR